MPRDVSIPSESSSGSSGGGGGGGSGGGGNDETGGGGGGGSGDDNKFHTISPTPSPPFDGVRVADGDFTQDVNGGASRFVYGVVVGICFVAVVCIVM